MSEQPDKKELAFQDWAKGVKPKEISEKHDIKDSTLRSWICRDFKKRVATKEKNVATKKAKGGAPKGNKNAVGNKGKPQPRNQNNLRHGAFSTIYWDSLAEEELELLNSLSYDEETELENQIALLTIRERRLMVNIKKFKDLQNQQNLFDEEKELKSTVQEGEDLKTSQISTFDAILKLETTLTGVQAKKTKALETLHKIRVEKWEREEKAKLLLHESGGVEDNTLELATLSLEELKKIEDILLNDTTVHEHEQE